MEIILKVNDAALLLRREKLAERGENKEAFQEKLATIQHEQIGCITDTQITTGNFLIAHCRLELTHSIQLFKEVEEEVIQLDFALRGESQALMAGKSSRRFSTGQHNICYIPCSKSGYDYYAAEQPHDYCVVVIPKEIYFRLLPPASDLHGHLLSQISQHKAAYMTAKNPPITPAMAWLIRDMRACRLTGSLKRLFLESRITELLMLQLGQMQGIPFAILPAKKRISINFTRLVNYWIPATGLHQRLLS